MHKLSANRCVPYPALFGFLCALLVAGCGQPDSDEEETKGRKTQGPVAKSITLQSDAFDHDGVIPKKHSEEDEDVSPPLRWSNLPANTKELALIVDDPDAPGDEPWVHWIIYKIPATENGLPEGVPIGETLDSPSGAIQGENSSTEVGYNGPSPPPGSGVHHYYFKLYALDSELSLKPGLDKGMLLEAISGHILAEGELIGTYER